jgi:hypothetical protein
MLDTGFRLALSGIRFPPIGDRQSVCHCLTGDFWQ